MRAVAQASGATWDAASKAFLFRGDRLPDGLSPFAAEPYSWERFREDELNGIEAVAREPDPRHKLRPHQVDGAKAILRAERAGYPGFLLADDVGLGKTMAAWAAALRTEAETILVVCPLAVVAHWRRTISIMGDRGKRVVVINYDRLKKLFDVPANLASKAASRRSRKKTRKVRTQKGIARYGEVYPFDLVVYDESHKLRNLQTARSALCRKIDAAADFLLWMSATAGQDPLELAYLAPILAKSSGSKVSDLEAFEAWCRDQDMGVERGKFGKWTWRGHSDDPADKEMGERDLERVRELLFGGDVPVGIRRSPSDIQGWPQINRILMPMALSPEDKVLYAKAWSDFRDDLGLERTGKADSKNALVARLRFRQKASLLRTAATVDMVEEMRAQGFQVAVSVAFRETMEVIRSALESSGHEIACIDGSIGPAEKEARRLDFQHGRATVCIYTVEEGISLHQGEHNDVPRVNLLHDVRWSAIQSAQIEGRTHRDGRFSQIYWLVGEGTVEGRIANVVARRVRSMGKMQGDHDTVREIDALLHELGVAA